MKVLKFGGTSVGSIKNIRSVKDIIANGDKKIVVLSAMSGTTNALVAIYEQVKVGEIEASLLNIEVLNQKYITVIDELFEDSKIKQDVSNYIDGVFSYLRTLTSEKSSKLLYNQIVSQGELMSTYMFTKYLNQEGVNARLLPALDFMRVDKTNDPDGF